MLLQVIAAFFIGALIGVLTGVVFLSLLHQLVQSKKGILTMTTRMLALPAFWFGGPWLGTKLMKNLKWEAILSYYLLALAAAFMLLVLGPLLAYSRRIRLAMQHK
jgi:hypothetical protein